MYARVKKGITFIYALVLFFVALPIYAAENHTVEVTEPKVIRVGFPIQGGLSYKDEAGNYSGYTYDYLQEISQYTEWRYEFVEVPGEADEVLMTMLEMLQSGELDIIGGMMKNQYTEEMFDFPGTAYGFRYTILGALEANTTINETNYYAIKGLRIGVYEKSVQTRAKLESFCEANNIDYKFVEFSTDEAMLQALKSGELDLVVENDLMLNSEIRPVAQFDGSPFYFAVTKGKDEIGKLSDIQNEKDEKKHLEHRAEIDGLTGIYNAVVSKDRIEKRLETLQKEGALLIIDIDNFKDVNDCLGHYIGDIVLQDFAEVLKAEAGKEGVAGRLGGDEFVLFVNSVKSEVDVQELCTRVRQKAERTYYTEDGDSHLVTISIGAALVKQNCSFNALYRAVDKALYASKNEGRNRHTIFTYTEVQDNPTIPES